MKTYLCNHHKNRDSAQGFTIIELMIALVVLSTILLIVTTAIMGMGNLYYKGQTVANTQNITSSAFKEIIANIEFSGNTPSLTNPNGQNNSSQCNTDIMWCSIYSSGSQANVPVYAYCIGGIRYSFVINREMVSSSAGSLISSVYNQNPTYHALYEDQITGGSGCTPLDLLQPNPELGATEPGTNGRELLMPNMRLINFTITQDPNTQAYDVTLSVAYGGDDVLSLTGSAPLGLQAKCLGTTGQQFCAVATLSSSINMRIGD